MIALIDADSLIYIIAWHFRDSDLGAKEQVGIMCDSLLSNLLKATKATRYLGAFSGTENFRQSLYKFAPYKGTRRPKDEHVLLWKPIIIEHYMKYWQFFMPKALPFEADDVICAIHESLGTQNHGTVVCSPDKDLRQIPGLYFDYRRIEDGIKHVDQDTASYNFWMSMLMGDSVDNIKGLPGIGPVKAKALLVGKTNEGMAECVQEQYFKAFGEYYGPEIYTQTLDTIQLVHSKHRLWDSWALYDQEDFPCIIERHLHKIPEEMLVTSDTTSNMSDGLIEAPDWL